MNRRNYIKVYSLGLQPYTYILEMQRRLHDEIVSAKRDNTLLLLRHNPVFTIGQAGKPNSNLLVSKERLAKEGIKIHQVERGGDITYHGPGQLMAYPLWRLDEKHRDLVKLVRNMEEVVMRMLAAFGVETSRKPGLPGIWVPFNKKIASVGLAVRQWVTFHGVAVNIREEGQEFFQYINPCGLSGIQMTSVEEVTGHLLSWDDTESKFIEYFADVMGCSITKGDVAELL